MAQVRVRICQSDGQPGVSGYSDSAAADSGCSRTYLAAQKTLSKHSVSTAQSYWDPTRLYEMIENSISQKSRFQTDGLTKRAQQHGKEDSHSGSTGKEQ